MDIELAVGDGVVITTVTCRAEDAVSAYSEAVIGRRVAIVTAGVWKSLWPVASAKRDRRLRNNGDRVGSRVDNRTSSRLGGTEFHLRRHYP